MRPETEFLTVDEAAALLGVKPATIYAYVSRGRLKGYRRGILRQGLYRREEVLNLLKVQGDQEPPAKGPEPHVGLSGVEAAETAIAALTSNRLTYRGYDIVDLAAHASYASVVWLLLYGELPSPPDLSALEGTLIDSRDAALATRVEPVPPECSEAMPALLATYAAWARDGGHPVGTIPRAIATIGAFPALVAKTLRGDVPPPATLDFAASTLEMLRGRPANPTEAKALNIFLVCLAENESNASTFSARVVASTLANLETAVLGALAAMQGPLHGGAYAGVREMIAPVVAGERPAKVIDQRTGRVPGFGHAVYRDGDPRAPLVRAAAESLGTPIARDWIAAADSLAAAVVKRGGPLPNIDFYAVPLMRALDVPIAAETPLFAIARTAGWTAHILEQQADNRLIRPRARYVGRPPRPYPLTEQTSS